MCEWLWNLYTYLKKTPVGQYRETAAAATSSHAAIEPLLPPAPVGRGRPVPVGKAEGGPEKPWGRAATELAPASRRGRRMANKERIFRQTEVMKFEMKANSIRRRDWEGEVPMLEKTEVKR